MRYLTRLAALMVAAFGTLVIGAGAADAVPANASIVVGAVHNYDSLSWSTCYAERVDWTASATIKHSHPVEMTPTYVDYHCCAELDGLSHRWYFATRNSAGTTWSHNWSPVYASWCPP